MAKSIQALLKHIPFLGDEQFGMVEAVRWLLKKTFEPLTEDVKYGGTLFTLGVQFCSVFAYKKHVSVEFGHGAKMIDAEGFLEGAGKGRRHTKLRNINDLSAKKLAFYLPLALVTAKNAA